MSQNSLSSKSLDVRLDNCDVNVELKETRSFLVNVTDSKGNIYVITIEIPEHEFECKSKVSINVYRESGDSNLELPIRRHLLAEEIQRRGPIWFDFEKRQIKNG